MCAILATCVAAALAACVSSNRPDAATCAAPEVTLELTLAADDLAPSDPAVCRDQRVTLVVESEVDGVLHIHGYDEQLPATEVRQGQRIELSFEATTSGQFPVELHTAAEPGGLPVGVFTVHEP